MIAHAHTHACAHARSHAGNLLVLDRYGEQLMRAVCKDCSSRNAPSIHATAFGLLAQLVQVDALQQRWVNLMEQEGFLQLFIASIAQDNALLSKVWRGCA